MKTTLFQIAIFLLMINSCLNQEGNQNEQNASNVSAEILNASKSDLDTIREFELHYVYAGLGSGMGKKGPKFKITGNKFLYTRQQNSSTGEFDEIIDTICQGEIKLGSIDSIKNIVSGIKEAKIYETNSNIMSGGIHSIGIVFDKKKLSFTLHNASHPKAKEIIKIVNSNIPMNCGKLSLWEDLDERDYEEFELVFPDENIEEKK